MLQMNWSGDEEIWRIIGLGWTCWMPVTILSLAFGAFVIVHRVTCCSELELHVLGFIVIRVLHVSGPILLTTLVVFDIVDSSESVCLALVVTHCSLWTLDALLCVSMLATVVRQLSKLRISYSAWAVALKFLLACTLALSASTMPLYVSQLRLLSNNQCHLMPSNQSNAFLLAFAGMQVLAVVIVLTLLIVFLTQRNIIRLGLGNDDVKVFLDYNKCVLEIVTLCTLIFNLLPQAVISIHEFVAAPFRETLFILLTTGFIHAFLLPWFLCIFAHNVRTTALRLIGKCCCRESSLTSPIVKAVPTVTTIESESSACHLRDVPSINILNEQTHDQTCENGEIRRTQSAAVTRREWKDQQQRKYLSKEFVINRSAAEVKVQSLSTKSNPATVEAEVHRQDSDVDRDVIAEVANSTSHAGVTYISGDFHHDVLCITPDEAVHSPRRSRSSSGMSNEYTEDDIEDILDAVDLPTTGVTSSPPPAYDTLESNKHAPVHADSKVSNDKTRRKTASIRALARRSSSRIQAAVGKIKRSLNPFLTDNGEIRREPSFVLKPNNPFYCEALAAKSHTNPFLTDILTGETPVAPPLDEKPVAIDNGVAAKSSTHPAPATNAEPLEKSDSQNAKNNQTQASHTRSSNTTADDTCGTFPRRKQSKEASLSSNERWKRASTGRVRKNDKSPTQALERWKTAYNTLSVIELLQTKSSDLAVLDTGVKYNEPAKEV